MPNMEEQTLQQLTTQNQYLKRLIYCAKQDNDKKRLEYYRKHLENNNKDIENKLKEMKII